MRLALCLCFIVAALAKPGIAQGQLVDPFESGNNFVRECPKPAWQTACLSYVLGLYHGNQNVARAICLPSRVDTGQLYEVGSTYIRNNPAEAHYPAFVLIMKSWRAAFPCPQPKK